MLSKTTMLRSLIATLSVAPLTVAIFAENDQAAGSRSMERTTPLRDFQVIELRRYTTREGEREHFAKYFETYFPEAFQQLGSIVFGQFFERKNRTGFTWIRGFRDIDAKAIVNAAFYYGRCGKSTGQL